MSIDNTYKNVITETHRQQYLSEGYFILERIIPDEHLKILRDSCEYLIDLMHQEMDRQGTDHIHISHRGKRYHIAKQYDQPPRLKEYVFSPLMAEVCKQTIGDEAYLFYDPYVAKAAEQGIADAQNNLGMMWKSMGELDSTMAYYQSALDLVKQYPDSVKYVLLEGSILNNIATIYEERGEFDKTIPILC